MRTSRTARFVVPALLALLLTGCAGGTTASAPTTSAPTTSPPQNFAADAVRAAAANLKLSDFPSGWTQSAQPKEGSDAEKTDKEIQSCAHTSLSVLDLHAKTLVTSPLFSNGTGNTVESKVDFRATAGQVQAVFRLYRESRYLSCLKTALATVVRNAIKHPKASTSTLPPGFSLGRVLITKPSFLSYGADSIADRFTIPLTYEGQRVNEYFDVVSVPRGRAFVSLLFEGSSISPFITALQTHLIDVAVGRLMQT